MNLKEIFVANLKNFRKRECLSQMALAEICDTSASYIGEIEIGRKFPSIEMVEKIAAALKVDAYRLFIDESGKPYETSVELREFLLKMPNRIKQDISAQLMALIGAGIDETLSPK
jgi:transcriptional regulator with XRE-family HTH domain